MRIQAVVARVALLVPVASLVLVGAGAASAQSAAPSPEQYRLRVEYLWWKPPLSGEIQKGVSDVDGTLLDVESDLGIEKAKANDLRGSLRLGSSWKLRGSWTPLDFGGDVPASQSFVYGTTLVLPGQRVVTSLRGNYFTGELEWDFVKSSGGFLGLTFGAKYFDVDVLLLNADTSSRVAETRRLPIPVVGLAGRTYLSQRFSLGGEVSGLTLGNRGHVWEIFLAARVHLSDRLAGTGGWRKVVIEGRDGRDFFNLSLSQWTYGVELSL
jgi:hypothetical protein